ncbi:MAG: hypothetical protein COB14_08955 [Alphaproteobacteria bacterium]|nr:MAG: hypothetical protein COB14_08955 [Alphaproteobacteria bacterium]
MKRAINNHPRKTIYMILVTLLTINTAVAETASKSTNHLINAFSPYLQQHAHNPVNWYPWGAEALEKARRDNKPILISIGYSTCYWCHVLEREVFTQPDAAKIMNDNFINIKIDREVRPDIDEIYMTATQLITGRGGWPNNVILTHDLKPFAAVTYLPKKRWIDMMQEISDAWKNNLPQIKDQANQVTDALRRTLSGKQPLLASLPAENLAQKIYSAKTRAYDNRNGGFGTGMKFPQETGMLFLLDHARNTKTPQALEMVKNTVDHMLRGGIHDHIGGGFHRYATDAQWRIPHFEKMLYNQALMTLVLAQLYEETNAPYYKHALTRLLDYIARDMTDEDGAFYSAQDAETNAVEGAYYVWNETELQEVLAEDDYATLMSTHKTQDPPHFSGHKHPDGDVLYRSKDFPDDAAPETLNPIFAKLLSVRQKRESPLRDDKILSAWNGMMIYALAESARILNNPTYLERAEKAAQFILNNMKQEDGRLYRIYMDGQPHQNAFLEDYAWLARGLMALCRETENDTYKAEAIRLIETTDLFLLDKNSRAYFMSDDSDTLLIRLKTGHDAGSIPPGNAVMAHAFVDLYIATGNQIWKDKLTDIVSAFGQDIIGNPTIYSHMIHAMMRMESPKTATITPPKTNDTPLILESKSKVNVRAQIIHSQSTATHKSVKVTIKIDEGWHLNANPASLDFLIPTVVDIQSAEPSTVQVDYPKAHTIKTPLTTIKIYKNTIDINATIDSKQTIETSEMRTLIQVQACQKDTCYPPSQITVNVLD